MGIIMDDEPIVYKYSEPKLMAQFWEYIDSTYSKDNHYAGETSDTQALDLIFAKGHGVGFCVGSVEKYVSRYGSKEGRNRKDLVKALHYSLLLLHIHDLETQHEA